MSCSISSANRQPVIIVGASCSGKSTLWRNLFPNAPRNMIDEGRPSRMNMNVGTMPGYVPTEEELETHQVILLNHQDVNKLKKCYQKRDPRARDNNEEIKRLLRQETNIFLNLRRLKRNSGKMSEVAGFEVNKIKFLDMDDPNFYQEREKYVE